MAKEILDAMDEEEKNNNGNIQGFTIGDTLTESYSDKKISCPSPNTTAPTPPQLTTFDMKMRDFADMSYSKPLLLPLRLQALGNLKPNGMKHLSFNMSTPRTQNGEPEKDNRKAFYGKKDPKETENLPKFPSSDSNAMSQVRGPVVTPSPPPPPPPLLSSNSPINETSVPSPPPLTNPPHKVPLVPSMPIIKVGTPPPPPPGGVAKLLRPKKANTKLKRSAHMGNLYRTLKGKVEGSSLNGKHCHGKKSHIGGCAAKQGMSDALAEMTKRFAIVTSIILLLIAAQSCLRVSINLSINT